MANMRPSWPLPSTPMVEPGRIRLDRGHGRASPARTRRGLLGAERLELRRAAPGREVARMPTASRAALAAPALPIASVATGTPLGIWTIESSESRPLSAWLCDRHAEHRQHRLRRDHARQVRGAAGAGDDHLDARGRRRSWAYSAIQPGVRCAETTRHSCGTPNRRQHLVGVAHRLPVGLAAHDDGDERAGVGHGWIIRQVLWPAPARTCLSPG